MMDNFIEDLSFRPFGHDSFTEAEIILIHELSAKYYISVDEIRVMVLFVKNMKTIMGPGTKETEISDILNYLQDRTNVSSIVFKHGKGSFKIENPELIQTLLKQVLKFHWLSKYMDKEKVLNREMISILSDNHTIIQTTKHLKNRLLPQVDKSENGQPNQTTISVVICEIYAFYKIGIRDIILSEKEYKKDNISYRKYADDRIRAILKSK